MRIAAAAPPVYFTTLSSIIVGESVLSYISESCSVILDTCFSRASALLRRRITIIEYWLKTGSQSVVELMPVYRYTVPHTSSPPIHVVRDKFSFATSPIASALFEPSKFYGKRKLTWTIVNSKNTVFG